MDSIQELMQFDPAVAEACRQELKRQRDGIELIASENVVSPAVLMAMGSILTNKYAEGYPGKRYYGGCQEVDKVEEIARQRACQLFGAEHANVQPHSGANANLAVFYALLNPGDTVMGMNLQEGGHLSHGSPVYMSGNDFHRLPYGVEPVTETIDYAKMRELALSCRPKLIVVGASAYPRIIDFEACRKIADEVGAYLMVDMAHIAGLVAAGAHPSPIPYAHLVTTTTHKTLRGPRGGMILCREELAKQIDKAIFPGTQGGPLMHIIAAKAVALGEAMTDKFRADQFQTVKNAAVLAEELMGRGLKLVSGGTDNHLMLLKLTGENITGKDLEKRLDTVHITANKNTIPGEPLSPFITSGLRLGTPAVTSRGFRENEMVRIAGWITDTIRDYEGTKERVTEEVLQLCSQFPLYPEMAV